MAKNVVTDILSQGHILRTLWGFLFPVCTTCHHRKYCSVRLWLTSKEKKHRNTPRNRGDDGKVCWGKIKPRLLWPRKMERFLHSRERLCSRRWLPVLTVTSGLELAAWDSVRSHVLRAQSPRLPPPQAHPQVVASLASEWPAVNWGSISMPGRRAHRTQGNIVATFTCSKEMISLKAGIRMRGSVGWDLQEPQVLGFVFLRSWRAGTATLLAYSWVLAVQQASSSSTV